jgi:hypothetical protein
MALDIWSDLRDKLPQYKAEHERLGRLIAMIEGELGPGDADDDMGEGRSHSPLPNGSAGPGVPKRPASGSIGRDDFVGLSTSEAIKAFLASMGKGKPQGPRDMAKALIQGGRGDTDENTAYANVTASLKRMKKKGEVTQVRRGEWGLSSWYGAAKGGE